MHVLGISRQTVHGAYRTRRGWKYKRGRKKHWYLYVLRDNGVFGTIKLSPGEVIYHKARWAATRSKKKPKTPTP